MRTFTLLATLLVALTACSDSGEEYAPPAVRPASNTPAIGANWSVPNQVLEDKEALALLNHKCAKCHVLDRVRKARTIPEWKTHIERMMAKPSGALINTCDAIDLAHWLTKKYGE